MTMNAGITLTLELSMKRFRSHKPQGRATTYLEEEEIDDEEGHKSRGLGLHL